MSARLTYGVFERSMRGHTRWKLAWRGGRPMIFTRRGSAVEAARGEAATGWEFEVAPIYLRAVLRQAEVEEIRRRVRC